MGAGLVKCHKCGRDMAAAVGVVPIWRCNCGRELPRTRAEHALETRSPAPRSTAP